MFELETHMKRFFENKNNSFFGTNFCEYDENLCWLREKEYRMETEKNPFFQIEAI